jgi:hypothetical protein
VAVLYTAPVGYVVAATDNVVSVLTHLLLLLQMNYNNKNNLVGALLVAGYDKHNGGQVRPARSISNISNSNPSYDAQQDVVHSALHSALLAAILPVYAYACKLRMHVELVISLFPVVYVCDARVAAGVWHPHWRHYCAGELGH